MYNKSIYFNNIGPKIWDSLRDDRERLWGFISDEVFDKFEKLVIDEIKDIVNQQ